MELMYFMCGENVIIDRESNDASVINILDDFGSPQFPIYRPKLAMLAMFRRKKSDPERVDLETVIRMGKAELFRMPHTIDFAGAMTTRHIGNLHGLVVPGPGNFTVSLSQGDKLLSKLLVKIWTATS